MTIGEVSKNYDISIPTLRYYERIGLIPSVKRNESGVRQYTPTDCEWVYFIKCMRASGMSVELLIEYVTLFQQGDGTKDTRKTLLLEQREVIHSKIAELQDIMGRLDRKISEYDSQLTSFEEKLR